MTMLSQGVLPDKDDLGQDAEDRLSDGLRILARIIAGAYLESNNSDQGERTSNEGRHGNQGTD